MVSFNNILPPTTGQTTAPQNVPAFNPAALTGTTTSVPPAITAATKATSDLKDSPNVKPGAAKDAAGKAAAFYTALLDPEKRRAFDRNNEGNA